MLAWFCTALLAIGGLQVAVAPNAHAESPWRAYPLSGTGGARMAEAVDVDGGWVIGYDATGRPLAQNFKTGENARIGDTMGQATVVAISGTKVVGQTSQSGWMSYPYVYDLTTRQVRVLDGVLGSEAQVVDINGDHIIGTREHSGDNWGESSYVYNLSTGAVRDLPEVDWEPLQPTAIDGNFVAAYQEGGRAYSYNISTKQVIQLDTPGWEYSSTPTAVHGNTIVGKTQPSWSAFIADATSGTSQAIPNLSAYEVVGVNDSWVVGVGDFDGERPFIFDRRTDSLETLPSVNGKTPQALTALGGGTILGIVRDLNWNLAPTVWTQTPPIKALTPTVSGTTRVGSTLTVKTGTWSPSAVRLTYQWYRDGKAIGGATGSRRVLASPDLGRRITVKVTGTKTGYTPASATSKATPVVAAGTLKTATPTIGGTKKVGSTLTVYRGIWAPSGVTFTQRWLRDGKAIPGATGRTRKLSTADRGHRITVRVTGKRAGYSTAVRTSAKTAVIR